MKQINLTVSVLALLSATPAFSQTAIAGSPGPEDDALPPIPGVVVEQTEAHHNGQYTEMDRDHRLLEGGQIQEAWDYTSKKNNGVVDFVICDTCTYKVRLREEMITIIKLPDDEEIKGVDIGDIDNFKHKIRRKNTIALKPMGFGGDTNMIIYGTSGRIYPFYLRTEGVHSKNVPDLVVNIGREVFPTITIPDFKQPKPAQPLSMGSTRLNDGVTAEPQTHHHQPDPYMAEKTAAASMATSYNRPRLKDDFVKTVPFDPNKLYGWGDYSLWGDDELEPVTVFRDDRFTYIKYGEKFADIELPTAYQTIDGIDTLVNSHVMGDTFVIESLGKLISLKAGEKYLCIEFTGERRNFEEPAT
jgi:ComB9 competence protein